MAVWVSSAPRGSGLWRGGSAPIGLDGMESMPVGEKLGRYRVLLQGIAFHTLLDDPALLDQVILAHEKKLLAWLPTFVHDHTGLEQMVTEVFEGSLTSWTPEWSSGLRTSSA